MSYLCNLSVCRCSILQESVTGESTFCLACGHGGYAHHMQAGVVLEPQRLSTGCGYRCLFSQSV